MLSRARQVITGRLRDQRGYTLFELVVSMTIFAVVLITAIGSYVSVSQSSSKAGAQRNVQQDARFNIEEIARQARAASVDYTFYNLNSGTICSLANKNTLALLYTEAGAGNTPVTKRVEFFYDTSVAADPALYRYETANTTVAPDCSVLGRGKTGNQRITANNLKVSETRFIVAPDADPYNSRSATAAQYTHPRVTIQMTVQSNPSNAATPGQQTKISTASVQTAISTRSYPQVNLAGQAQLQPPSAAPLPSSWSAYGVDFTISPSIGCQPQGLSDYCRNPATNGIPNAVSALSASNSGAGFPNQTLTYRTTAMLGGTYKLTLTYRNEVLAGLPVPPGYSYQVSVSVNGGPANLYSLPATGGSPAGSTPGTYTVPGLVIPNNQANTIVITWNNDSYAPGSNDANFALVNLGLAP